MIEVHVLFVYYFFLSMCWSGGGKVVANIWNQYCDMIKRPDKKVAVRKLNHDNPYDLFELWKKTDFLVGLRELSAFSTDENVDFGVQEIRNAYDFILPDSIFSKTELENLEREFFGSFYKDDKRLLGLDIEDYPISTQQVISRDLRGCIFMKELLLKRRLCR